MSKKTINVFILRAIPIDVTSATNLTKCKHYEAKEIDDNLSEFYEIIECDCIDIVKRKIGNKYYNIVCDDESLLKNNPTISVFHPNDSGLNVFGTIIIAGEEDEHGNLTSIDDCDIKNIRSKLGFLLIKQNEFSETKVVQAIVIS